MHPVSSDSVIAGACLPAGPCQLLRTDPPVMIPNKAHLRREILARRDALPPETVEKLGEAFASGLGATPLWRKAVFPALYVSTGGEASTRMILDNLFREGRAVALPRVEEHELRLHRVTSWTQLVPGKFGILEPLPETPPVGLDEPDLILAPGVAFDRRGHRIGYGKGFYDRLLAQSRIPVLALAYGFQLVPHVPDEEHDRRMDFIRTPDELIACGDAP